MSFADLKARTRRRVHAAFAVPCNYYGASGFDHRFDEDFDGATPISARFHDRMVPSNSGDGYAAQVLEGVTRIVFDREELITAAVVPRQFDVVEFIDYGISVRLQNREPYDGPINERWTVSLA